MKSVKKTYTRLFVTLIATLGLAACAPAKEKKDATPAPATEVTIQDATGEVTVMTNPKKIVVLDNGVADTIRALGYEDSIVGMPSDSLPTYLKDLGEKEGVTNVGNLKEVNVETIAGLEPDLIIASGRTAGQVEEFKKIAPTVYFNVDSSDYWGSVQKNITEFAKIFGEKGEKTAAKKIAALDKDITAISEKNADSTKTTLTVLLNEGNMAGMAPDGRYAILYQTLGFKPTSLEIKEERRGGGRPEGKPAQGQESGEKKAGQGQEGGQQGQPARSGGSHGAGLSFESVSEVNPDIIFVIDRTLAVGGDTSTNADVLNNALIQATTAAKEDKIVTLTSDLWYLSGGGLESTAMMVEEVAAYAGK